MKIFETVSIFSGGDFDGRIDMGANEMESVDVVGGNRLLKPFNIKFLETFGNIERFFRVIGPVCIHVEFVFWSDELASFFDSSQMGISVTADFYLESADSLL